MITGLEGFVKVWPMVAVIGLALIGYGEIRADIHNLQTMQQQNFTSMQQQITNIQNEISQMNK